MEVLYYVGVFVLGWLGHTFYLRHRIQKAIYSYMANMEEKIEEQTIILKLEQKGDVLYAFDSANDRFLTQGDTLDQVKANLSKQYPENSFTATRENMQELGLL